MKKFLSLLLTLSLTLTAIFFTACKKQPLVIKESDTYVIIKVETDKTDLTLANYMASLEEYKDKIDKYQKRKFIIKVWVADNYSSSSENYFSFDIGVFEILFSSTNNCVANLVWFIELKKSFMSTLMKMSLYKWAFTFSKIPLLGTYALANKDG